MMVDDIFTGLPRVPYSLPDASWLAGAVAGLQHPGPRTPSWLWDEFISDIYDMIRLLGDVKPAEPGTTPKYDDGQVGSAYDALGGYVSVCGEVCPEGLFFRVPVVRQEEVVQLFKGLTLHRARGNILVPHYDLPAFLRLVPLEGPLAEQIEQEVYI
ncbi:hypothetical protein EU527_02465 [Candidatus Thorarchaeota archaeon]|nr:MAG: hypothetical protein EU527_02465 [Candidatus Thorarchaeota archaeon]